MSKKRIIKTIEDLSVRLTGIRPKLMLIVYSGSSGSYVECADIDDKLQVSNVFPLSEETVRELIESTDIYKEEKIRKVKNRGVKAFIPKNLIYINTYDKDMELIWYVKHYHATLLFTSYQELKETSFHIPTTVFHLNGKRLKIYVTDKDEVDMNTIVYSNPYPNGNGDQGVCYGNSKFDNKDNVLERMDEYTRFFFDSKFSSSFPEKTIEFWEIAKTKRMPKAFYKVLDPLGMIKSLI